MSARLLLIALLAIAVLGGCSTPQIALDQANTTAALTVAFEGELGAYRGTAARVAAARLDSIRRQETLKAKLDEIDAFNIRTARLAGLGNVEDLRRTLIDLAESRTQDQLATRQRLADIEQSLAKVVQPLPAQAEKLRVVQKALAALGTELPAGERLRIAIDAVKTVRDEIDKNRKAAEAASASTPKANVPPAP